MVNEIAVLIVGAGPSGLTMAVELHRHNIPFRIIDSAIKPVPTSNALAVQPRTLELWDDEEILSEALQRGIPINKLVLYDHNQMLGEVELHLLETLYPFVLALPQHETERLLLNYLQKHNIKVEMLTKLVNFSRIKNKIEVHLKDNDNQEEKLVTSWLIACDGAHSTVRRLANLPFQGKELPAHFIMCDAKLKSPFTKNQATGFLNKKGPLFFIPFNSTYTRILAEVTKDPVLSKEIPPTFDHFVKILNERCPFDITIENIIWSSRFSIHERIIDNFQHENIFFVGDSAHLHSPAGGQGMNTGIQDAYNLGWKLAYVLKGYSPLSLLETFNQERYPVAKDVLKRSTLLTDIVAVHNKLLYLIRNKILSFLFNYTKLPRKFATINSELSINYKTSSITKECLKKEPGPKAGEQMIDCYVNNSTDSLLSYVRGTAPCLLFFTGIQCQPYPRNIIPIIEKLSQDYKQLFNYVLVSVSCPQLQKPAQLKLIVDRTKTIHQKYQATSPVVYFIRPDKYIGFRGSLSEENKLFSYIEKLFLNTN